MSQPVSIENDHFELAVWPQFGGRISSLIDKSDGYELLFSYPDELPTRSPYGSSYAASWHAGWDECFPAVAGRTLQRTSIRQHCCAGSWRNLEPAHHALPTVNGITIVWNGLRFGYRLTRKLSLDGPSVRLQYTLINLAPFPFHFVWAMHLLLGMEKPVELKLPTGPYRFSHDAEGKVFDSIFNGPTFRTSENLVRPNSLPSKRGWKAYSNDPIAAAGVVIYPERGGNCVSSTTQNRISPPIGASGSTPAAGPPSGSSLFSQPSAATTRLPPRSRITPAERLSQWVDVNGK